MRFFKRRIAVVVAATALAAAIGAPSTASAATWTEELYKRVLLGQADDRGKQKCENQTTGSKLREHQRTARDLFKADTGLTRSSSSFEIYCTITPKKKHRTRVQVFATIDY